MRNSFLFAVLILCFNTLLAQDKELNVDSTQLLKELSENACKCIDSVYKVNKQKEKDHTKEITRCIEPQVGAYQLGVKLMATLKGDMKKDQKIEINIDTNSDEYKRYYRQIESWLRDNCKSLGQLMSMNTRESDKSFTDNDEARAEYNKGIDLVRDEKYKEALPYFEKAVSIDPLFAFAWDNVGVCHRRMGNYEQAVIAYKKSLAIDPAGAVPLQNLPVAYEFLKKYDEAIEAYDNLTNHNANDPEAFFGKGRIQLLYKKDMEEALRNMCKAYNLYTKNKSPYRADAEKIINMIYGQMKSENKLETFNSILKEHHISPE